MNNRTLKSILFTLAIVVGLAFSTQMYAQKNARTSQSDRSAAGNVITSPQSIQIEDFNYTPGQLTDASGGANVSGGNWITNTGTGNFLQVTAGSLSYSGYPSSAIGNKLDLVSTTTSAEDTYRSFAPQTTGTTTYAAFMVNVTNTTGLAANSSTTGDYFAGFSSSTSTSAFASRVTIRAGSVADTYQLGFRASSNAGNVQIFSTTDLPIGTTALVVISYQVVAGAGNDVCNIWVNPTLGGAEPVATLSQVSLTDNADVGKFFFRQGNLGTPNASVDGVRIANSWASIITATPFIQRIADFNGDGRTDWALTRNTLGLKTWYIQHNGSASGEAGQFGLSTDKVAPADYDGDGKTDVAVWREAPATQAAFYILESSTGTVRTEFFGQTDDQPTTVADYDGDGKADVSVYRAGATAGAQSFFYYRGSLSNPGGIITYVPWGINGDTETVGDFDGDGKGDFCVRRDFSGQGVFILLRSSDLSVEYVPWGVPTDTIVPGDYDADGRSDFALARIVSGAGHFFILERDGGGTGASPIIFGNAAIDFLAPGDYDGDGRTDIAIWRPDADPSQNYFWVRRASNGAVFNFEWGQAGDEPVSEWNVTGGN